VYTDGYKIGDSVGAAGIIFVNGKLVQQLKFKLQGNCTNNQAQQVAILKSFRKIRRNSGWTR
jgi:ribonuclease HI